VVDEREDEDTQGIEQAQERVEHRYYLQGQEPEQFMVVPFGEGLRRRRKALNISQTDVGGMVGADSSTITKYESRIRPPRDNYLVDKLATVFGTTRADLLAGRIPLSLVGLSDMVSSGQTATRAIMPASSHGHSHPQPRIAPPEPVTPSLPSGGEDVLAEGEVGEIIADVLALEVLSPEDIPSIARLVRGLRRLAERNEL
jgi:hypothetical protein